MRDELSKNSTDLTALITSINPYVVVFGASACGLIIEIVAGRILAPTIGVSLYTWTTIIGVVLAGISLGSYLGGLVADRFPSPVTLGLILLAAVVSSLTVLPLIEWVPTIFGSMPAMARIIFLTTALFFLPSLILGMVTPVVIKLRLKDLTSAGNVIGRFYAVSTAGSIFGTFITGFVLIQWIGVRSTILLVALLLLFMALAFGELWRAKRASAVAMALFLGIGGLGFADGALTSDCLRESNYYCIRVTDTITERGYEAKALHLDKLIHNYVSPDDPSILLDSYNLIFGELADIKAQRDPSLRMFFIGGGGYTLPRYIEQRHPQSILEVAEIDPEVTRVAFDYLGLRRDTRIVTFNQDARVLMPELPKNQYDLVIGDAFNDISVPYHLTTLEFNQQVRELLTDDGIYAVNVVDQLYSGQFLAAFVRTLERTFPYVYLIRDDPDWSDDTRSTYVVVGALQPLSLDDATTRLDDGQRVSYMMPEARLRSWLDSRDASLLTDDFAPVDNMLASVHLEKLRVSGAERRYASGLENHRSGDLNAAIDQYSQALKIDPQMALAVFNRGQAYAELAKTQLAIQDFDLAIGLNPYFAIAYYELAKAYAELGDYRRVIAGYDQVTRLNPKYSLAYLSRGVAFGSLGLHQQAIQDLDEAITLDPEYSPAYYNRGHAYLMMGQFNEAIRDLDEAIRLNPDDALAHQNRASANIGLGDLQQAVLDLDEAIRLDPTYARAYNNRASTFINLGDFRRAVDDLDEAIRLDPTYVRAYNNRASAYISLGKYLSALQDLDQAISLDAGYATAYANRAIALYHLDMESQAQVDIDRAIELGFDRSALQKEVERLKN